MKNFILFIVAFFIVNGTDAQSVTTCDTISMPDTTYVCTGTRDTLRPIVSGGDSILSYTWTPAAGLSSSTISDPVLAIGASGWFHLSVQSLIPDNLITNGSFTAGNTGFTSSYTYVTSGDGPDDYEVGTDPSLFNPGWPDIGDHTTGTGNMLCVDGDLTAGISFWCESVPVTPGTNYVFSVWSSNLSSPLPVVRIKINGVTTGTFAPVSTPGDWTEYQLTWPSGISTTADICMSDESTVYVGNDFAIDDISFEPLCIAEDSTFVDVTAPDTTYAHTDTTVCASVSSVTLTAPPGYTAYHWSTGATTSAITVTTSGTYWLLETGPCVAEMDTFNVTFTPLPPVNLGDDTSFCSGNTYTLRSSDTYPVASYLWNTGSTAPSINVTTGGTYWLDVTVGGCTGSDTVVVNVVPTPPAPFLTENGPLCSGSDTTLILTASLGAYTSAATFTWAGPQGFTSTLQTAFINPVDTEATGIYSAFATFGGCISPTSTEAVLVDSTPVAPTVVSTPVCAGGTLNISASTPTSGVTYFWTGPGGFSSTMQNLSFPDATTVDSGNYTVILTRGNCYDTAFIDGMVDPIPVIFGDSSNSPANRAICSGLPDELSLYAKSLPYYAFTTYNWTGPNGYVSGSEYPTILGPSTLASGYYTVTATLGICTSADSTIYVLIDSTPAVPAALSNTPVCEAGTLSLTATDPTAGVTYSWAGPDSFTSTLQDPSISNVPLTAQGMYSVYVAYGNPAAGYCYDSSTTYVNITPIPSYTPTSNSPVCTGDTLKLFANAAAGSTFAWSGPYYYFPALALSATPIILNATIENAGVYTVTALYNGCYLSKTDTVIINVTPPPPSVSWLTYCQYYPAAPLMADATGITWYGADTVSADSTHIPPVPSTQSIGSTFFYLNQTANGCTSAIDSIQVTVNPKPSVTVTPADTGVCPHSAYTITAYDTDLITYYHWYPATYLSDSTSASATVSPETGEVYTVIATNAYGCTDTATAAVVVYPAALISLGDSVTLYPGQVYTMTTATNCTVIDWFPPAGLSNANIPDPVVNPLVSTKYIAYGATSDGCTTSDSISIYVTANSLFALPNAFTPGTGANNVFKIIVNGEATLNYFRIFNRWGEKVFETTNINDGWDGTFNGTPQPLDVYVYEIEAISTNGQSFTRHGNVTLLR